MTDIEAIRALLHRYADAVCQRDADQWGATWAEDGVWDLGGGREVGGREAMVAMWLGAMSGYPAVVHMIHNHEITVADDGASATGRVYIGEYLHTADGGSAQLFAHYDDEYTKTSDGWQFARRQLNPLYQGPADLSGTWAKAQPSATEG